MTAPHYYSRRMRHPLLVEKHGLARDALHDVVQSMNAITAMMSALLEQGEDRQDLAIGVHKLLDQQCAMLAGIYDELGEEQAQRDEAARVARRSGIPTEALVERARELRMEFIQRHASAGVDHSLIGAALNLSHDDVGRVVGQLRGEMPPRGRAARAAQA